MKSTAIPTLITRQVEEIAFKFNPVKGIQPRIQISTNRDLLTEATNIGDLKRYNMMLQNISLSSNVKNYLNNNRQK